jgi:hypothetical protein
LNPNNSHELFVMQAISWSFRETSTLKVFTNEKRGGLRVISFDRPPFKLLSRKFSKESVQCRPHPVRGIKPLNEHLFLLFANNY